MTEEVIAEMLKELRDLATANRPLAVLEMVESSGTDPLEHPEVGVEVANALLNLRRNRPAIDLVDALIETSEAGPASTLSRRLFSLRANLLVRLGRLDEARADTETVLMGGYAGLDRLTANATNVVGIVQSMVGEWEEAIGTFRRAATQYQLLGLPRGTAAAHQNMGLSLGLLGRFEEAEQQFVVAQTYFLSKGSQIDQIGLACERSLVLAGLGDTSRAASLVERALEIAEEISAATLMGDVFRAKGSVWASAGQYEEALSALSIATDFARADDNVHLLAEIAEARGDTHRRMDQPAAARKDYTIARSAYASLNASGYVERLNTKIGWVDSRI